MLTSGIHCHSSLFTFGEKHGAEFYSITMAAVWGIPSEI